jgi:hypothetical protein
LLIFFYYKIFIEFFVPITGDELNSILVYSADIKTLLLKNFPGNIVFFHLIGYLKSELFGYNLITFRSLTFLFLILHFVMFHKIYKNNFFIYLFLFLVINSSIAVYSGLYICYIFKSFIYVLIFYLHCFIISSILTGISLLKVQDTSFVNIIFFSFNNFFEILFNGIN